MDSLRTLWPPIRAIWRILAGQNRRGRIVNRWARLVIFGVAFGVVVPLAVWPFVLLGVALTGSAGVVSAVAFLPLVGFPVFMIALAAVYPLLSGILVTIPGIRVLFGWLFIVIFAELIIGLYLAAVPVWNNPGLIPVLALLVVVLGMWLVLKRQLSWRQGAWFTKALTLAIAVVTIAFFFGGKPKEKATEASVSQADSGVSRTQAARVEEFTVNAGEELDTVETGPGTKHWVLANRDWLLLSMTPKGEIREYRMAAGRRSIIGTNLEGPARVKGVQDGTTLSFERFSR